jgi:predicted metal-dependent hydrolase
VGSCSRTARSLNWRLVQMPERVRDYVIWHELITSAADDPLPRFWREVAAVALNSRRRGAAAEHRDALR